MSMRRFFLVSLALAILAIGAQGAALWHLSHGAHTIARAVQSSDAAKAAARVEANGLMRRAEMMVYVGVAAAVASVAFVVVSTWRQEPARRSVTFAILIFYLILDLTFV